MAKVILHMLNPAGMQRMYDRQRTQEESAVWLLRQGVYSTLLFGDVDMYNEDAAEEMFDLTNNPGRHEERTQRYGHGRSLSTGDIVQVDETLYLCCSMGWKVLHVELPPINRITEPGHFKQA